MGKTILRFSIVDPKQMEPEKSLYDVMYTEDLVPDYEMYRYDWPQLSDQEIYEDQQIFIRYRDWMRREVQYEEEQAAERRRSFKNYTREEFRRDLAKELYIPPEKPAPRKLNNPITGYWVPEEMNDRQIEWAMKRKRRLYKEGKIPLYIFNQEMKQLAILRKHYIQTHK